MSACPDCDPEGFERMRLEYVRDPNLPDHMVVDLWSFARAACETHREAEFARTALLLAPIHILT